jgi:hypothetical protein
MIVSNSTWLGERVAKNKDIPPRASAITLAWINKALADHVDGAVKGFDLEILGEGEGFTGQIVRVVLRYDDSSTGPASVIVKLPTEGENRAAVEAVGAYEREIRVYTELADRIPLLMPDCLFSDFDEQPGAQYTPAIIRFLDRLPSWLLRFAIELLRFLGRFSKRDYVLVLEDLSTSAPGNQVAGCDVEPARLVLVDAAAMHAEFWGAGTKDERAWLLPGDIGSNLLAAVTSDSMPAFRENFRDELDDHALSLLDYYQTNAAKIAHTLHESPLTLIHGDLRLDNIFFETDGSIRAFADWQGVALSPGAWDVAYFLSGSLVETAADGAVEELLGHYHSALVAHGVNDYDYEDFRADVDLAFILMLGRISALEELDFGDDRGPDLIHGWVRRLVACVRAVPVPSDS